MKIIQGHIKNLNIVVKPSVHKKDKFEYFYELDLGEIKNVWLRSNVEVAFEEEMEVTLAVGEDGKHGVRVYAWHNQKAKTSSDEHSIKLGGQKLFLGIYFIILLFNVPSFTGYPLLKLPILLIATCGFGYLIYTINEHNSLVELAHKNLRSKTG